MELFGFKFGKANEKQKDSQKSFVNPSADDGAAVVTSGAGGYYGTYVDLDATAKSESDLITRYRQAAMFPECDTAIEEIVTEAIAATEDEPPVTIDLDQLNLSDNIKGLLRKSFDEVLTLLKFEEKGHDIFRRWYIDGRIYYHKVIDNQVPALGIQELRFIDPRKIRKVREIKKEKMPETGVEVIKTVKEYYIYNEAGLAAAVGAGFGMPSSPAASGLKIALDSIVYCHSGIMDLDRNVVLSYLHKAIKPVNQLKMMEDSLVIYRISRAPERRIFYIDIGNLPAQKADQYLKGIMDRYRNKIVYDSSTGEIRDDRKFMSMLEDFWLPRREGGRGTEIDTLPGGENLGQIEDINYFKTKLYQSLNVPISRLQTNESSIVFSNGAEITRDELQFGKFIDRLRKKFSEIFNDLLKSQLILKSVITEDDWTQLRPLIKYKFAQDQYFKEAKECELNMKRIEMLTAIQPFVGVFYSQAWIRKNIMRLSNDEEIKMMSEIQEEPPPLSMLAPQPINNNS